MKRKLYWHENPTPSHIGGTQISNKYWFNALFKEGIFAHEWKGEDDGIVIASNFSQKYYTLNPQNVIILQHTTHPAPLAMQYLKKVRKVIAMTPESARRFKNQGVNAVGICPYIPKTFKPLGLVKKAKCVHVSRLVEDKGIPETLSYITEPTHFYGPGNKKYIKMIMDHPLAEYKGVIENEDLPWIYNGYEKFVWRIPRYVGYGRVLVEAALCGLEIDVNRENFGVSRTWNLDDPEELRKNVENELTRFVETIKNEIYK